MNYIMRRRHEQLASQHCEYLSNDIHDDDEEEEDDDDAAYMYRVYIDQLIDR
jgi:hypothetical protein